MRSWLSLSSVLAICAIFIEGSLHRHVHVSRVVSDIGSCWGVWVTPSLLMTTAHCVSGASQVTVSNEDGLFFGVNRVIVHNHYDAKSLKNDIAVLSTMVLNGSLRNEKITFSHVMSEMVIHKNDTSERLSLVSCTETDFDFDFCASHHGCHDSLMCDKNCKGDSGLPVFTENGEVVGLVSGGPERCERNAVPGGYVSLYEHKQFIIRSIELQSSERRTASEIETRALSGAEKNTCFVCITLVLLTLLCL